MGVGVCRYSRIGVYKRRCACVLDIEMCRCRCVYVKVFVGVGVSLYVRVCACIKPTSLCNHQSMPPRQ